MSSEKYRHIKANEIIVTDHPYMFTDDPHIDAQKIPNWIMDWLKEKFLINLKKSRISFPKKIYIDRSDSKSNVAHLRTVKNEKEIQKFLTDRSFETIKLSDLSFHDQVQLPVNLSHSTYKWVPDVPSSLRSRHARKRLVHNLLCLAARPI